MQDPKKQRPRAGRARPHSDDPPSADAEATVDTGGHEPKPDPFVAKLVRLSEEGSGLATLVGYLGDSPRGDEFWRLYLTLQLDEYVDIFKQIARIRPIPNDTSPLRRIAVWIPADADVFYTRVDSRSLQASFLQGEIARAHAPQPGEAESLPPGGLGATTLGPECATLSVNCAPRR